jgi:hypothetical protein
MQRKKDAAQDERTLGTWPEKQLELQNVIGSKSAMTRKERS